MLKLIDIKSDKPVKLYKPGERFWLNEFLYSEKLEFGWRIVRA